ncbi:MAG: OmpA family protein [Sphingobacteriales bacterium]|jgi:outer membrane protein OmpA-like peptidoglycan-associated protein|nr:MAG: OmpA family protein [Sphingobacteriales bacterium]
MRINKYILFLFVLAVYSNIAFAQHEEGGIIGETWMGGAKNAEKLYGKLAYHDAIPLYNKLLKKKKTKDDPNLMAHLADAYRWTGNYEKAAEWYTKANTIGGIPDDYKLLEAQMLQTLGKTDEAKQAYKDYLTKNPSSDIAKNQLQALGDINYLNRNASKYNISNLAFNSKGYDFAPVYKDKQIIYASSRDKEKAIGKVHSWTGTTYFDMYSSKGEKLDFKKVPSQIKKDASTKFHEAAPTFTQDGKTVYFTRNNFLDGKVGKDDDRVVNLKIYEAEVVDGKWINDKNFPFNNDAYSVGHPALTADGNTMYFVSDMPGGKGGTDLYVTTKSGDSWSNPINLTQLNTTGNEMFPNVDDDGNLTFSSNGLPGLGGLDIFKVKSLSNNSFTTPENIGAPINSTYDDFGFVYADTKEFGYFTSDRPGGKGLDDIYGFQSNGIFLEGIVVDAITNQPICTSKVNMLLKTSMRGTRTTKCDGNFTFDVEKENDYCFQASADGYQDNNSVCASTKNIKDGETVYVKIPLKKNSPADIQVQIIDKVSQKPIKEAAITLTDKCDETKMEATANGNGQACFTVKCGCDYVAIGIAKGYQTGSSTASTKEDCDQKVKCTDPNSKKIIVELDRGSDWNDIYGDNNNEVVIELKDIYYDFDKWYIRQESESDLNKLLDFLKENPKTIVEIGSHTDARATTEYNNVLSQKRAQSVVDWLLKRGISKDRLKAKGYGESSPRNQCTDNVICTEYEHQRNRRTEFKIVGGEYDIRSLERFDMKIDPCAKCPF